MPFTEGRFFIFFLLCFAIHWSLRRNDRRKLWLLACSYLFYAAWDWRFLALIFLSTAVDFVAGWRIARAPSPRTAQGWLVASLTANLGILGFFKYFNFFVDSGASFLELFGLTLPPRSLEIVLPVGISFFTFQSMSYTIDLYRGRIKPVESFSDFALFVAFFPQLVAGPIVRARGFLPQLTTERLFSNVAIRSNLILFLVGFTKKACIADQISGIVDPVFASPEVFSAASKWLAISLYHVQIYCDFSGYTDMAIATAGLLGYRLTPNFDFPYLAHSIREFWRRWHISLSTWFRDYLYIPLGGNRRGRLGTYGNLMAVFLLCGLWHGAAWTFVAWGTFHGGLLLLERGGWGRALARLGAPLQLLYVQLAVISGWVFFRSSDLSSALHYLRDLYWPFGEPRANVTDALDPLWLVALLLLGLAHGLAYRLARRGWPHRQLESMGDGTFAFCYGAALAWVLPWVATGHEPFIYFQF